jgi:hypothetical protein
MFGQAHPRFRVLDAGAGATELWWQLRRETNRNRTVRGTVIAVHDRVVVLEFDCERRSMPRVLALGRSDVRAGPLLSHVASRPGFSFAETALERGTGCLVTGRGGPTGQPTVRLEVQDGPQFILDTARLSLLPAGDRPVAPLPASDRLARAASSRRLLGSLEDCSDGLSWLPALSRYCRDGEAPRVAALVAEVVQALEPGEDETVAVEAATRLVGRGPGSTPAGDDLLCGLLVALSALRGLDSRRVFEYGQRLLAESRGRTPTLSFALLRQATMGRATAPVSASLDCLFHPESVGAADSDRRLERLCDLGHTSGPATLAGLLTAMVAVVPELENRRTATR